ncbi:lipase member H-like [Folsomia candida]|nr:lipase member H-like [Folsomia candida]
MARFRKSNLIWKFCQQQDDIVQPKYLVSLGAQLAGRVGRDFQLAMGGRKIPRISDKKYSWIWLDLAGPLFYPSLPEWIIDKSDAYFVDLYHSNAGEFGTDKLDGHVDFIINNGHSQPGCNPGSNLLFCSHQTAQYLFADSIDNAYVACQCSQKELDPDNFEICVQQCPNPVFAGIYTPHT